MNIRQLKVFNEVCRCMNMTTASKNLYVSQPSISKTISELEDWYGTKLFVRINKTLVLTPSGKIVAEYSQKIVDMVEQMDREIKEKVHCDELVRLGVSITTRTDCLSGIMAAFKEKITIYGSKALLTAYRR